MNIVLVQVVYNEIKMLPWKYKWAQENGIKVFTLDNNSTDGSWEWLERVGSKKRNVHYGHERLETFDIFSLALNNRAIIKKFHEIKPDWCIVAGCDSFYQTLDYRIKLDEFIRIADETGYNLIDNSRVFNFYYTGLENDNNDPRQEYFYYEERRDWDIHLITKYRKDLDLEADKFQIHKGKKLLTYPNLVTFHYWFRSDAKDRFIMKWQRRHKSWEKNIDNRTHGDHYPDIVRKNTWIRNKNELQDIRKLQTE